MHLNARRMAGLIGVLLGIASWAVIAVAAIGYRQQWWTAFEALDVAQTGFYAAVAGFMAGLGGLLVWAIRRGVGLGWLLAALVASAPVVGIGLVWQYRGATTPAINDISTDTQDPPVFWDTPSPTDYPSANVQLQEEGYPDLAPLKMGQSPMQVFEMALALVKKRGWTVLAAAPDEGRIEAMAYSPLFGFADEVALRIEPGDGGGTRVDMRSRSRIGRIDRGANARRIERFLRDLGVATKG